MLTSNQRKLIIQLSKKKHRISNKLFVAEGKKVVNELKKRGHIPPDTDASIKEILKFAESVGIKAELYTKK